MGFRGIIWWLGAFIFAAMAGILTYGMLTAKTGAASEAATGNTRPVVVAAIDIPFRRSIGEAELVVKEVPVDAVPEGAATSLDQVIGKMSTVDVVANAPLLTSQLVTPDVVTRQVSLSVPKGKLVTEIPTESKLISNRLIRPGDRIDLLATVRFEVARDNGSGPMPATMNLLPNLEVHAIILPTTAEKGKTQEEALQADDEGGVFRTLDAKRQSILVAVDVQDAQMIRFVLDAKGSLDLVLRGPGDDTTEDTKPVDQYFMAEKFGVDLVREGELNLSSPYPEGTN